MEIGKGSDDLVLAQMNATTGAIEWHKVFASATAEEATDLAVTSTGDLMLFGRVAVSYTHLRAHETVLDLVCRLMLGKKNKKLIIVICNTCTNLRYHNLEQ